MKKNLLILSVLLSMPLIPAPVKLESKLLKMADGTFFIADTVEMLRKFQRRVSEIILGTPSDAGHVGKYEFRGSLYNTRQLAEIENNYANDPLLHELLEGVKLEFLAISKEFESAVRSSKNTIVVLIEESCEKRGLTDSLLLTWADTTNESEAELFIHNVGSFAQFDRFCIDLLNFFSDLIHSCPKAQQLFKERIAKWKKFKTIVDEIKSRHALPNEHEFLKYVKSEHLDKLSLHDITENKVKQLIASF